MLKLSQKHTRLFAFKQKLRQQAFLIHLKGRIREIPFNMQFTEAEQDKELMKTLTQKLPDILNWAIEGCLLWQANGLSAPASVTASVSEYRSEMDTVCSFIVDECIVAAHERIPIGNLYEQYVSWRRSSGKHPRTKM